jgi:hypothetical protein
MSRQGRCRRFASLAAGRCLWSLLVVVPRTTSWGRLDAAWTVGLWGCEGRRLPTYFPRCVLFGPWPSGSPLPRCSAQVFVWVRFAACRACWCARQGWHTSRWRRARLVLLLCPRRVLSCCEAGVTSPAHLQFANVCGPSKRRDARSRHRPVGSDRCSVLDRRSPRPSGSCGHALWAVASVRCSGGGPGRTRAENVTRARSWPRPGGLLWVDLRFGGFDG